MGAKNSVFYSTCASVETIGRTLIIEYLDQHSHVSDVAGLEIFHASRLCAAFVVHERDTDGAHDVFACCVRRCMAAGKIKIYPAQPGERGNYYVERKTRNDAEAVRL